MTDLFSPRPLPRRSPEPSSEPPVLPTIITAEGLAYVTAEDGCSNCGFWARANAATGFCDPAGGRPGALTSFAHCCPRHVTNLGR